MNIETVNELIQSLESAGKVSIREQKFLKLAKAFKHLAAENVALKSAVDHTIEWIESTNGDPCDVVILKGIRTPATDRIVAGIKADGVEEFIGLLQQHVDEVTALRRRIAELESRTVKLPDLRQIVSGDRYVWSDGVYNYSQDVKVALADAGIKVEAE